jgi:hypothetical protein
MITFVLLVVAVLAAMYVWQHKPSLDNAPVPGLNVVTINPLPSVP